MKWQRGVVCLFVAALFAISGRLHAVDFGVLMEEGNRAQKLGDYPRALASFSEALLLPLSADARAMVYNNRGGIYGLMGNHQKALADFKEAIELNPQLPVSYSNRGNVRFQQGDYRGALEDYREAAKLSRETGLNGLAWLLATCPDATIRNGREAVAAALEACELTRWQNSAYLDTLAAAYAEIGDFLRAVEVTKRAQNAPGVTEAEREDLQRRLDLYRAKKPYRDEPKR